MSILMKSLFPLMFIALTSLVLAGCTRLAASVANVPTHFSAIWPKRPVPLSGRYLDGGGLHSRYS
jgi:hypothetical protein